MKNKIKTTKGKRALSVLLALVMVLSVASPAMSPIMGIIAKAADADKVELAFNNLFVFEEWANNAKSGIIYSVAGNTLTEVKDETAIDITNGKITLTGSETSESVYTGFSMYSSDNVAGNTGYYAIDVEPDTEYMFFYNLSNETDSTVLPEFNILIFMFNEDGAYIGDESGVAASSATSLGDNGFTFTTSSKTTHIQVRFTLVNKNALTTVGVNNIKLCKYSTYSDYTDYNNLFVFDKWATNNMSGVKANECGGKLIKDFASNSFVLTGDGTSAEVYTGFSNFGSDNVAGNTGYYAIDVEPNTPYVFSYTDSAYNNAALPGFSVLVFEFDESNACIQYKSYGHTVIGDNSFTFVTTATTSRIQVRFTLATNNSESAVQVKNIKLYKGENLFDFGLWYDSKSSETFAAANAGTINSDLEAQSITFVTSTDSTEGDSADLFTNYSIDTSDSSANEGFYKITVTPNTTYTVSYNITGNPKEFMVDIAGFNDKGLWNNDLVIHPSTILNGNNIFSFTTGETTTSILFAFGLTHGNKAYTCTLKDIVLYKSDFADHTDYAENTDTIIPHRQAYTYSTGTTYATLPTPKAPDGYVFAGWAENEDGSGKRFTDSTALVYQSYTVYPKFEPKVDNLEIATYPTKTNYTLGERLNTTGLVLKATIGSSTLNIPSGYYCTPEILTATGEQTIYASYGGKTVSFTVNVNEYNESTLPINGTSENVKIANNGYTFDNYLTDAFNRYELTYYSDSYVKGVITFVEEDESTDAIEEVSEEFFLEPATNGSFASYIDGFLDSTTQTQIVSIKFTCLNNDFGSFTLNSINTIYVTPPNPTQTYSNSEYDVGISLDFGGVVSSIIDKDSNVISAAFESGTQVGFSSEVTTAGATETSDTVNLINKYDRGRYLQQSYYGTSEKPYEMGNYNGLAWNYNPVQGGNLQVFDEDGNIIKGNESSKVIDYRITDNEIYVKTRPLDWGKNSADYPDSYNTPSYMEAWYTFDSGIIKVKCRFVDYSGYPSATTTQELPALYTVEPLNNFVYYSGGTAWDDGNTKTNVDEPDFWGVSTKYNELLGESGQSPVDPIVECNENWAAFTQTSDKNSFGIGVYSPGITEFHYGCFPAIYNEDKVKSNSVLEKTENRHATSADPATENPTSYIAPVGVWEMESYKAFEYSYYITTGTATEIRSDFEKIANEDAAAEYAKPKIAVPETAYLNPTDYTTGQYYVNNILNTGNYYNVETVAESTDNMYFGLYVEDAQSYKITVTNVTDADNDIELCATNGTSVEGVSENISNTVEKDETWNLKLTQALAPGETATAKWEITVTLSDGSTETYTAYTVMYAPERTVGAVAESRYDSGANTEISSWITGANGVDHSQRAPLGSLHGDDKSAGYFEYDPLVYPETENGITNISGSSESSDDYINKMLDVTGVDNGTVNDGNYVIQTATSGSDGSRAQSYLGLLAIDKSRYTNTNEIPNLKMGWDVLRVGSSIKDSLEAYTTYYTLGTADSYTSTSLSAAPSGWTQYTTYSEIANSKTIPYREGEIPSYTVSDDIDGKYIHALNQGNSASTISSTFKRYATAGTSVLIDITDKGDLRDLVLSANTMAKEDYSESSYATFTEALQDASTVLGDPSASQEEIEAAEKTLSDATEALTSPYLALKYDNLFSALEFSQHTNNMTMNRENSSVSYADGVITTTNTYLGTYTDNGETKEYGEAYTRYDNSTASYLVEVAENTEYVFEFDVTTDVKAQAFMFFYNSNGSGVKPTKMEVKIDDGEWVTRSPGDAHWGVYPTETAAHYAIKFTTGAGTVKAGFRFGNTSPNACTSTFSNIKLIDSDRYYEDVEYTKTEAVFKEYTSYGSNIMPLERTGYTFLGWSDADGTGITSATQATEHLSIYSQWKEKTYTITYNANGGNEDATSLKSYSTTYSKEVTLSAGEDLVREGYVLLGWSTSSTAASADYALGQTVSGLTEEDGATVTLYAVWAEASINVTFDNLFDFSKFNISENALTINERTGTGFTVTAKDGSTDANTGFNGLIDVVPGKTYILTAEIDFEPVLEGNTYDIYINTLNVNQEDDTSTPWYDSSNGAGQDDEQFVNLTGQKETVTNPYIKFTAGETTEYIKIRFDANAAGNKLTVDNIRIWEDDGVSLDKANKVVGYGLEYGDLPTPTKTGYKFDGWKNADNEWVTADSKMESTETVNLYSQWTERQYGIFFDANGGTGTYDSKSVTYSETFTLPSGLTADGATFLGWSLVPTATTATYAGGATVSVSEIKGIDLNNTENITFYAVWELTDDSVVDDTAVADFGLALTLSPYSNDTAILSTHTTKVASSTDFGFSTDNGTTISDTATGKYGSFSIDKNAYTVTYTPSTVMLDVEEITLYSKLVYSDGSVKILKNTITVVPASNVYYEEGVITTTASGSKPAWESSGEKAKEYQDGSTDADVYGYDSAYADSTGFSNGTYYTATVSSTAKTSDAASFEFVGTGFDLISACGTNTGVQRVKLYKYTDLTSTTKTLIGMYVVDTYLGDTDIMTDGLLHQVPVISYRSGEGTKAKYYVETSALYLSSSGALKSSGTATASYSSGTTVVAEDGTKLASNTVEASDDMLEALGLEDVECDVQLIWMDDNSVLNGGTGAGATSQSRTESSVLSGTANKYYSTTSLVNYIDGVRIYSTMEGGDSNYIASEQNATYYNIINEIELDALAEDKNIIYVEASDVFSSSGFDFDAYKTNGGPKGEIYLKEGQGIAFTFTPSQTNGSDSLRVMLGMRAVKGSASANVYTSADSKYTNTINSATEMYYDVSSAVTVVSGTATTIYVENTGDGVLALNNLKLVNGELTSTATLDNLNGSATVVDGTASVPTPVVPTVDASDELQDDANADTTAPETDVDTNAPEADTEAEDSVEEETDISIEIPGVPAPIASFLELLFKFLAQLVGSFGF